jgi:adenylosuccinate lyase
MSLNELTAITPLDGRYRKTTEKLSEYLSEYALIQTRVELETSYLLHLSKHRIIRQLSGKEKLILTKAHKSLTLEDALSIKTIEDEIHHDVKAVEIYLRKLFEKNSLKDLTEFIHFGLTSEDINNIAYRLMLKRSLQDILFPELKKIINSLAEKAKSESKIPMMARTHGQDAVPTTLGKELANFGVRLSIQYKKLRTTNLAGKLNGAVGNFSAHKFVLPKINWQKVSSDFVFSLGLTPNPYSTQINPFDDVVELLQIIQRTNTILVGFDQDMWRYISDGWFIQNAGANQVGSSTMAQKINPIDFENSEGNLKISNALIEEMSRSLPISRLQRDLSNSTLVRNLGVIVGHSLVAYKSSLRGTEKIQPDRNAIKTHLNSNWSILAEALQTELRFNNIENAYEKIRRETMGKKMDKSDWHVLIASLGLKKEIKEKLQKLTPEKYIGDATDLTIKAVKNITNNLKDS